jgi:glucose dehydrogenase
MRVEEPSRGGTLDGTPVVVDGGDGITTGAKNVLAIDVKTGDVKWRYRRNRKKARPGRTKVSSSPMARCCSAGATTC